jgi:hypothetical protein
VFEDVCKNTGLSKSECNCLTCSPSIHRFKFLGLEAECKTMDDIIDAIQAEIEYFISLKEKGYKVGGAIADDYLEIYPPRRKGFYWSRCKNCGSHLELSKGTKPPERCDFCEGGND